MRVVRALITVVVLSFLLGSYAALALDPSLHVSQYAHTAWTARDGFSEGSIFAMAQTPVTSLLEDHEGTVWVGAYSNTVRQRCHGFVV